MQYSESVLLVDDDRHTLRLFYEALRQRFEVLIAPSATSARRMVDAHAARLAFVICDLLIPDAGGYELFCDLVSIHPRLKVFMLLDAYDRAAEDALLGVGVAGALVRPKSLAETLDLLGTLGGLDPVAASRLGITHGAR